MTSLPSPADLENSPVWSVIRAAHTLERRVTALFDAYGLTPVQFGVLCYLAANGPMTTADLARSVLVRPQSMAGVINTMDRRGLVTRHGPRGKGRSNPISLTPDGGNLLAVVWAPFEVANTPDALGLSTAHAELLPRLMSCLRGAQVRDRPQP